MKIVRSKKVRDGVEEHCWVYDRDSVTGLPDKVKLYVSTFAAGHLLVHGITLFSPLALLWLVGALSTSTCILITAVYFASYLFYKPHFSGNAWYSGWARFHDFWEWNKHYSNFKVIRRGTTESITGRQLLFGIAPHGILAANRVAMMGHIFFEEMYPCTFGRFAAATPQFYLPGTREIAHWGGAACDASKRVCVKAMNSFVNMKKLGAYLNYDNEVVREGTGLTSAQLVEKFANKVKQSLYIWVGGSKELMTTDPDSESTKVVILDRKGFVKLAIEQGIDIVPSVVFGEKWMYHRTMFPLWLRKFLYKYKIPGLIFYGRFCTLMPYNMRPDPKDRSKLKRLQMGLVFGEPIKVNKQENVDPEYLDQVHARYIKDMKLLFETYRDEMGYEKEETLDLINTTDVGFI